MIKYTYEVDVAFTWIVNQPVFREIPREEICGFTFYKWKHFKFLNRTFEINGNSSQYMPVLLSLGVNIRHLLNTMLNTVSSDNLERKSTKRY